MSGLDFLARRLGKAVFVVLGVVVLNFLLIHLAPGDPATVMAAKQGPATRFFSSSCAVSSASISRFMCSSGST